MPFLEQIRVPPWLGHEMIIYLRHPSASGDVLKSTEGHTLVIDGDKTLSRPRMQQGLDSVRGNSSGQMAEPKLAIRYCHTVFCLANTQDGLAIYFFWCFLMFGDMPDAMVSNLDKSIS